MNLGALRTRLLARLNRDDCSNAQADDFISEALERVATECRYRCMELSVLYAWTGSPTSVLTLPSDYLQMIDVMLDGVPLDNKSYRELGRYSRVGGYPPTMFAIHLDTIVLDTTLPETSTLELVYYAEPAAVVADADVNSILQAAPTLVLYAALSVAGDHFQHEKTADWEARFQGTKVRLDEEKIIEEAARSPRAISPAYYVPDDD